MTLLSRPRFTDLGYERLMNGSDALESSLSGISILICQMMDESVSIASL